MLSKLDKIIGARKMKYNDIPTRIAYIIERQKLDYEWYTKVLDSMLDRLSTHRLSNRSVVLSKKQVKQIKELSEFYRDKPSWV